MPGLQIQKGTTYVNYGTPGQSQVTAENLNNHVDQAILLPGAISAQIEGTAQIGDYVLAEQTGSLFKYALSSIRNLFSSYFVSLTGGSMTGALTLNANPSDALGAATKQYVDAAATSATLSGAIVMWGGSSVPTGWLECNGQSTASAPNLVPIYGTNLPDLRGEFVRGWDGFPGRGVDPGRTLRSSQGQSIQPHTHSYTAPTVTESNVKGFSTGLLPGTQSLSTGSAGSVETRPRNVALMFIVKT
jgi:microcystin-dependent protein